MGGKFKDVNFIIHIKYINRKGTQNEGMISSCTNPTCMYLTFSVVQWGKKKENKILK